MKRKSLGLGALFTLFLAGCGGMANGYSSSPTSPAKVARVTKPTHRVSSHIKKHRLPHAVKRGFVARKVAAPAPAQAAAPKQMPVAPAPLPAAPAQVAPQAPQSAPMMGCIPLANGGDADGDNNGSMSDGDGCR